MNPKDFVAMIAPGAQAFQRNTGLFASVTIAQTALETGWGAFLPHDDVTGRCSYNLFGIKGAGSAGSVTCTTWEEVNGVKQTIKAEFRAYTSFAESIADHYAFLSHGYDAVIHAATPQDACRALQECGYATDSHYAEKLIAIIADNNLEKYDLKEDEEEMTPEEKALLQSLAPLAPAPMPDWFAKSGVEGKMVKLGATWSGVKSPVFYETMAVLDRAGIFDDAIKARGLK